MGKVSTTLPKRELVYGVYFTSNAVWRWNPTCVKQPWPCRYSTDAVVSEQAPNRAGLRDGGFPETLPCSVLGALDDSTINFSLANKDISALSGEGTQGGCPVRIVKRNPCSLCSARSFRNNNRISFFFFLASRQAKADTRGGSDSLLGSAWGRGSRTCSFLWRLNPNFPRKRENLRFLPASRASNGFSLWYCITLLKLNSKGAGGPVMLFHLPSLLANLSSSRQVRMNFGGCSLGDFQKQGISSGNGC